MNDITMLMDHYQKGQQDVDTRRTRKNGWDDAIDAYMSRLPEGKAWPYTTRVTDPRIRTTILEKNGRLLNAKLQGRLVAREGGDVKSARINNAILDFQWDHANKGGSMIEKIALTDQTARIFGAGFAFVYWDEENKTNEIKQIDPRDIFFDFGATHIKNAKWVQVREFTTPQQLKDRGYDIDMKELEGESTQRSSRYISQVLENRGLEDRLGQDESNPVVEVVTEWTEEREVTFLPRFNKVIRDRENPYEHGKIPIVQLRYYPLPDDIYGESEVEPVISLQRAINAMLCGFLDQMNMSMRPPVRVTSNGARIDTIQYGPGAIWIENTAGAVSTVDNIGDSAIKAFNNTYPALVAAFNTAMGDQSLGVSNFGNFQTDKTATEVQNLERQQVTRDQYNQLYLGEFLKDTMLMWLSNNQQFLFAEEENHFLVFKIIGRDNISDFENLGLGDTEIPQEALSGVAEAIEENAEGISDFDLEEVFNELKVPREGIVTLTDDQGNPTEVQPRLKTAKDKSQADLLVTEDDLKGVYDYIPDVKSMSTGAGKQVENARRQAFELTLNPQVQAMLQQSGKSMDISELLVTILEDAGLKDADQLFNDQQNQQLAQGLEQQAQQGGLPGGTEGIGQAGNQPGLPAIPQAAPLQDGAGGLPPNPQGL